MKFAVERLYADPEAAARKLIEMNQDIGPRSAFDLVAWAAMKFCRDNDEGFGRSSLLVAGKLLIQKIDEILHETR
jgi:hypothetical protein